MIRLSGHLLTYTDTVSNVFVGQGYYDSPVSTPGQMGANELNSLGQDTQWRFTKRSHQGTPEACRCLALWLSSAFIEASQGYPKKHRLKDG